MKETRYYKRFNFLSMLAVLGAVAALLFECFFVFELYNRDFEPLKRFLPAMEDPAFAPEPVDESAPVG